MKAQKDYRLTRKTAVELICSVIPVPKSSIQGGEQIPGVFTYQAEFGSLLVSCTYDCYGSNGRIRLTVTDGSPGNNIRMCFHPGTLNRDFVTEDAERDEHNRDLRIEWAQRVGREQAHRFVDQYCEGWD